MSLLKDEFGLVRYKGGVTGVPGSPPRTVRTWPAPDHEASMELDFDDVTPAPVFTGGYRENAGPVGAPEPEKPTAYLRLVRYLRRLL